MTRAVLGLMVAIVLGGSFGEASVEGTAAPGSRVRVSFEVEVAGNPSAVAVHVVDPGQVQETHSLIERGGGLWGGVADLDPINYVIVFEALYTDAEDQLSAPTTLMQLGLDPQLLGMGDGSTGRQIDDEEEGLSKTTLRWGWGAAALGALALAFLALWAAGGKSGSDKTPDAEPQDSS